MKNARKSAALSLGAVAVALGAAGVASSDTYAYDYYYTVRIPDEGLFQCLTTEGNIQTSPGSQVITLPVVNAENHTIAVDDIDSSNSLMALDCSNNGQGYGIKDLAGLGLFPGASHLGMSKITNINLSHNEIESVSPLSDKGYQILNLSDNKITDISPLANSDTLGILNVSNNNLGNNATSTLQSLGQLKNLSIGNTNISDLSFVSNLPYLERLQANNNGITDYSPLANVTTLEDLTLTGNASTDISPLSGLTNLTALRLAGLGLTDESYQYLKPLTNLETLDLGMNELTNIKGLGSLTNLTDLNVALNHISDFSGVPTSLTYEGMHPEKVYGQTITIDVGDATSVKVPAMIVQFMSGKYAQHFKVETWGGSYDQENNTINFKDDADVVVVRLSPADPNSAVITDLDPNHAYYLEIKITRTKKTIDNPDTKNGISTTAGIFGGLIATMGALFTIKRSRR